MGNIVYSSKTSLKDLLRAYYDYSVLSSSGIEINKIFIVKPWYQTRKNSKKNELKIIKTEYCNYKKSKATFDKKRIYQKLKLMLFLIKILCLMKIIKK